MKALSELERSAYMAGDWQHAAIYADMLEAENELEGVDGLIKEAEEKAKEDATIEALGIDVSEKIQSYKDTAESYKRQIDAFSVALKRIEAELVGDGCKTIAGRRSMAKALRSMRLAHGLF